MHSKEIETYKDGLILTERQRAILVGTLLGDGHLETQNQGRTYRLKIEHSIKQKEYVDWLYDQFHGWVRGTPYTRTRTVLLPGSKTAQRITSYGFTTHSHGAFRFYAHQFYSEKHKQIPKLLVKLLSPLSIAVWYMDNGSWKSANNDMLIIHTVGYTKIELERLTVVLQDLFGVSMLLHKQKQYSWRLCIQTASAEKFRELIESYIQEIPAMQ